MFIQFEDWLCRKQASQEICNDQLPGRQEYCVGKKKSHSELCDSAVKNFYIVLAMQIQKVLYPKLKSTSIDEC